MFTLKTSFKPRLHNGAGGGGGRVKTVIRELKMTVNNKEENS